MECFRARSSPGRSEISTEECRCCIEECRTSSIDRVKYRGSSKDIRSRLLSPLECQIGFYKQDVEEWGEDRSSL